MKKIHWLLMLLIAVSPAAYAQNKLLTLDDIFSPDPAKRRTLVALSGEIPSPFDLPKGCAFAGRCPQAGARCREERPKLSGDGGGHRFACFHPL